MVGAARGGFDRSEASAVAAADTAFGRGYRVAGTQTHSSTRMHLHPTSPLTLPPLLCTGLLGDDPSARVIRLRCRGAISPQPAAGRSDRLHSIDTAYKAGASAASRQCGRAFVIVVDIGYDRPTAATAGCGTCCRAKVHARLPWLAPHAGGGTACRRQLDSSSVAADRRCAAGPAGSRGTGRSIGGEAAADVAAAG